MRLEDLQVFGPVRTAYNADPLNGARFVDACRDVDTPRSGLLDWLSQGGEWLGKQLQEDALFAFCKQSSSTLVDLVNGSQLIDARVLGALRELVEGGDSGRLLLAKPPLELAYKLLDRYGPR